RLIKEIVDDVIEGIMAHGIAQVANGCMVTMILLQGVVNTFGVFLARIVAFGASQLVRSEMATIVHFISVIVFQLLFSVLGSIVVFGYSRHREFHADRGGAVLAGKDKMKHALESLKNYVDRAMLNTEDDANSTMKINNKPSLSKLFSTHPDLHERIDRLS